MISLKGQKLKSGELKVKITCRLISMIGTISMSYKTRDGIFRELQRRSAKPPLGSTGKYKLVVCFCSAFLLQRERIERIVFFLGHL